MTVPAGSQHAVPPHPSLPDTMRAWRLRAWGEPPELVEVPVPRPTGEEVLLRVEAAGLCHSDLHLMDAPPGAMPFTLPFTLGHEVVGTVAASGDDAGDPRGRYAVHGIWACGKCRQCRRGRENYCATLTDAIGGGIGHDGGLADYILVPSARHLASAEGLDPYALAPLTDAGLTAFHALRPHRDTLADAIVVVIGVGGLGHLALQLLQGTGTAAVVAVDPRAESRDLASRLGADLTLSAVELVAPALAERAATPEDAGTHAHATHPHGGADLVLDFVGATETLDAVPDFLAPGGQIVLVGSAGGSLTVRKGGNLPRGWGIAAPFWGTHDDLVQVVALAADGRVRAETETHPLADALVVYERLRSGDIQGRAVVAPAL